MTSDYRAIGYRAIAVVMAIAAGASCRLGTPVEPSLAGPSGLGMNVTLAATPDLLPRDGRTTSKVVVSARDGSNKPVVAQALHLQVEIENQPGILGSLSQTEVVTGADGTATVLYTPPLPSQTGEGAATIMIVAIPIGSNASNHTSTSVSIKLGEVTGGLAPTFTIGPDPMKVGEQAVFDARSSQASPGNFIVTYAWDFGDGNEVFVVGEGPTIKHEYFREGTFTVRLRIIDSSGKSATASRTIVVVG